MLIITIGKQIISVHHTPFFPEPQKNLLKTHVTMLHCYTINKLKELNKSIDGNGLIIPEYCDNI